MVTCRARAIHQRAIAIPLSMLMLMTVLAAFLSGCSTTAGFGKDVQAAGSAVTQSAEKHKSSD